MKNWKLFGLISFVLIIFLVLNFYDNIFKIKQVKGEKDAKIGSKIEVSAVKPPAKIASQEISVGAKAAILVDGQSLERLYVKNPDVQLSIASTTKIMTAMVVLDNYKNDLQKVVTVDKRAVAKEGTNINLATGEKIKVIDLLKGMLIQSGNDAAYAISYAFGDKDDFIKEMNSKAEFLGMTNTKYKDPSGLDDEGRSTANDLAILTTYALKNKTFADIVKTPEATITSIDGSITHQVKSSNRLILSDESVYMPEVIGVKTGFTYAAGHCLVSARSFNNHLLISVILNTYQDTITASAIESQKLLEWGKANWVW